MTTRNYNYYAVSAYLLKEHGVVMEWRTKGPKTFITRLGNQKYSSVDAKVALRDLDIILGGIINGN